MGERLAVVEHQVSELDEEQERHREKLHKLEGTHRAVEQLLAEMKEWPQRMVEISKRTAQETVNEMLERRDAIERGLRKERLSTVDRLIRVAGFVVAVAAVCATIYFGLNRSR